MTNFTNFCYEFGRAVAHFRGADFEMAEFVELCQTSYAALILSSGSNGLRDAMIGAFDEYKRIADLYDSRKANK